MLNFGSKFARKPPSPTPATPLDTQAHGSPNQVEPTASFSPSTSQTLPNFSLLTPTLFLGLFYSAAAAAARPQSFWHRHVISNNSRLVAARSQQCSFLSSTLPCNDAAPRSFSLCGGGSGHASGNGSARTPPHTPNLQLFSRVEPGLRYRCLLLAMSSRSRSRRRAAGGR